MTLTQRIKHVLPTIQVRHYHRKVPRINGSRPWIESSTARPSVMQQAFHKALI